MSLADLGPLLGILFFLSETALSLFRRAPSASNSGEDRGSLGLLWGVITLSMTLAVVLTVRLPQAGWSYIPAVQALAIALLLGGLALRWYSILYLGRYFTVSVTVSPDQHLVDTGPYAKIRHPCYTGALLAFAGVGMLMHNFAALAVILTGVFPAFVYRMRVEERALARGLGAAYVDYMRRTRRLIPGVY
jgi:protein-S-isoprenylcysteine O-methyltransferase